MNIRQKLYIPAIAIGALAIASISACNKDKGGSGSSGGGTSSSADMLTYLPKDTSIVIGVSWSKGKDSALFKKFEDKILAQTKDGLAKMKETCGIDPLNEITTVVVAVSDIQNPDSSIFAIKTKLTQDKLEDCFTKSGGTVKDGVYTMDQAMNVYWASKEVFLISKGTSVDALKTAAANGSIKDNAKTMEMVGKIKSDATVWAVGEVPAMAKGLASSMGATAPDAAYMSVAIDSGVNASLSAIFANEKDAIGAKAMVDMGLMAGKQDKKAGAFLKDLKVTQDGNTIVFDIKLSSSQIEEISNQ